jgi:hypothetical protein
MDNEINPPPVIGTAYGSYNRRWIIRWSAGPAGSCWTQGAVGKEIDEATQHPSWVPGVPNHTTQPDFAQLSP